MLVKIHDAYRRTIAICDSNLLGKKFIEGNRQIDLTGSFFVGEKKTPEEVIEIIRDGIMEDATFNIVGKKSCSFAKKIGIVSEKGIITIKNVPIALILI